MTAAETIAAAWRAYRIAMEERAMKIIARWAETRLANAKERR